MKLNTVGVLGSLVMVSLTVRFAYALFQPQPIVDADSYGYYSLGNEMFANFSLPALVNQYRTPLYPLFVSGIMTLTGKVPPPVDSPAFWHGLAWVVRCQIILGLGSVILFYLTLRKLHFRLLTSWLLCAFVSFDFALFSWERTILTETLATTLLLALTYLFVLLLQKPRVLYFAAFFFVGTLGWLTRPSLLVLPILILPIVSVLHRQKYVILLTTVTLLCYLAIPVMYSSLNERYHGYRGISQVADIDLLGKILEYNLPVDAGKTIPFYYQAIQDYRRRNGNPYPFRFLETYDPQIYGNVARINNLRRFNQLILQANWFSYLTSSVGYVPYLFSDRMVFAAIKLDATEPLSVFLYGVQKFYHGLFYLGYVAFLLAPLSAYFFWHRKTVSWALRTGLGLIVLAQMGMTVLVVPHDVHQEYSRLLSVIHPQLFLFLSAFAANLGRKPKDECEVFSASADFAPPKYAEKTRLPDGQVSRALARGASFLFTPQRMSTVTYEHSS